MAAAQVHTVQSAGSVSGAAIYTVHSIPPGPEQVPQVPIAAMLIKLKPHTQVSRSGRPSRSPSPSAHSFPSPSRDFQPTLLIRKLRPKVPQLGHALPRPISEGHVSASWPMRLAPLTPASQFRPGQGAEGCAGGEKGQTYPPACSCCCSPGPASACSAYVS